MEKPAGYVGPDKVNRTALFILLFTVFIDLFGFGVIVPILPFLATELGATGFQYGLIVSLYSLMQFIFAPIWGRISDRIGRKPVILVGLGGSAVGFAIFGFADSLIWIYAARGIAGIFTSATLTTANAYIADSTPPQERGAYFGLIAAAFGLGFAIGPAVGGLMADVTFLGISGYALPSFFAASTSFLNMIGAYFWLRESLPRQTRELRGVRKGSFFPITETGRLRNYPGVLLFITIFALTSLAFSNFIASFAIYAPAKDDSVTETSLGYYFTYAGLLLVFTQTFLIRPMINSFGEQGVVKIGVASFLIGFITLPLAPTFEWMFATNTFLMLGIGFLNPSLNALISVRTPEREQGTVLGINQGWASLMRVFGPIVAGTLFDINIAYPYYLAAAIFVIILIIVLTQLRGEIELPAKDLQSTAY